MIDIIRLTNIERELPYKAINRLLPHLTDYALPITEEALKLGLEQPNYYLYIAVDSNKEKDENIVGMALIYFTWRPEGWTGSIHCVVVDKNCRGKHLGQRLTEKLLLRAKAFAKATNQFIGVNLTSKPARIPANSMYQKNGFILAANANGDAGTNLYYYIVTP